MLEERTSTRIDVVMRVRARRDAQAAGAVRKKKQPLNTHERGG